MAERGTNFPVTTDAAARSIVGPTEGWADVTTTTSTEEVDLSSWEGKYITLDALGDDHWVAFGSTGGTMDVDAAAVGTALVPRLVPLGGSRDMVVPRGKPFLIYRAVSGTGSLRATRS